MTYAIIKTNKGKMLALLEMEKAPITAGNFKELAEGSKEFTDPKTGDKVKRPYFDGLSFHRVAKDFVVQGGCPEGNGRGGPGFTIPLECHPDLEHTGPGILSMARKPDPDSAGSQFFLTLKATPFLDDSQAKKRGDRGYAVFGRIIEGLDVVKVLGDTPILGGRGDGQPAEPLYMESVKIVEGDEAAARAALAAA